MKPLKIPYGISNFGLLREKQYLYVDKTRYIEVLENYPPYQFFIRPRRFGKSLFISLLEHYYDINKAADFDKLFGGTYIVLRTACKYLPESRRGNLAEVRQAVLAQLARYSGSELVASGFSGGWLKKVALVVVGKSDVYLDEVCV